MKERSWRDGSTVKHAALAEDLELRFQNLHWVAQAPLTLLQGIQPLFWLIAVPAEGSPLTLVNWDFDFVSCLALIHSTDDR